MTSQQDFIPKRDATEVAAAASIASDKDASVASEIPTDAAVSSIGKEESTIATAEQVLAKPKKQRRSRKKATVQHKDSRLVQLVTNKTREYVNHTYHDLSDVPPEESDAVKCDADLIQMDISAMTFNQKVYHILMQNEYCRWITWLPHGRGFRVDIPVTFEREVCPKYFNHKRYSSFLRQLNNHGYRNITQGKDRNAYYHESLLRGRPHLLKFMPEPKDARRLIPDPENEPDLYSISKLYPLERDRQIEQLPPPQGLALNLNQPPILTAPQSSVLQSRLASSVDWLADGGPASKRLNHGAPMHHQHSATSAFGHAFLNSQVPSMSSLPMDLPLPQLMAPVMNGNNMSADSFLLNTLLQQMAANPQFALQNNLQAAAAPYQLQQQSQQASMADWLRQQGFS
ncbi:hypothetical protein MPSEU_001019700 [Mayamaea pseudoterrestris]|nr:hypothetical protein MPSEU_001019700 [Mayamaea pseudoterrestris]